MREKLLQLLSELRDGSSVHGIAHLQPRRHPLEWGLWLTGLVLGVAGATNLSLSTWQRFQENPTVVSMERNYQEWNTSFPAVTICPRAKYNPESVSSIADQLAEREELVVEDASKTLREILSWGYDHQEVVTPFVLRDRRQFWKYLYTARFNFSYVASNSNSEEAGTLTHYITEMGYCYSYNSLVAIYNSPRFWESGSWKLVTGLELFQGNPLDGDTFAQILTMNSAYELFVHSPTELPDRAMNRILPYNGSYKTLDLTALSIYSTAGVRALSVAQRKCRYLWESLDTPPLSPAYSYNSCRVQCRMRLALALCGCLPHFYRPSDKYETCDHKGLLCLQENSDLLIKLRDPKTDRKTKCECFPPCDDVNYTIESENTMDWSLGTSLKWGLVKYPRLRLKRDILFGWADLLVAVGGTAGLFLGGSLLSIAEILYFSFIRLPLVLLSNHPSKRVRSTQAY